MKTKDSIVQGITEAKGKKTKSPERKYIPKMINRVDVPPPSVRPPQSSVNVIRTPIDPVDAPVDVPIVNPVDVSVTDSVDISIDVLVHVPDNKELYDMMDYKGYLPINPEAMGNQLVDEGSPIMIDLLDSNSQSKNDDLAPIESVDSTIVCPFENVEQVQLHDNNVLPLRLCPQDKGNIADRNHPLYITVNIGNFKLSRVFIDLGASFNVKNLKTLAYLKVDTNKLTTNKLVLHGFKKKVKRALGSSSRDESYETPKEVPHGSNYTVDVLAKLAKEFAFPEEDFIPIEIQGSSRGGVGDFLAGFLLGGAVFGTLAYVFAPQIRRSLLNEDESGFQRAQRPIYYDNGLEKTRQTLNTKISQLNSAIDNVSSRLRGGNNSAPDLVEADSELETNR
ncbi:hypothetical protein KFK09_001646 [Dendrobium nobile]|uniref:Uncharacterized protein n=1 Tax=Dendrobium nobile TaxID=94219 RepID=A0A8T3C5J7_DENNO|nr:hypothetical protein KFK09_001646 [Dendrobium nobile]